MLRTLLLAALTFYASSALAASSKATPPPKAPLQPRPATVIRPKPSIPKEPSRFEIVTVAGKKNELEIRYTSSDPALTLDTSSSIVIQLNTPPSLVIEPSVITSSDWPNGATKRSLAVKGALAAGTWIDGAAAYTVCKAKKCRPTQSSIRADFR